MAIIFLLSSCNEEKKNSDVYVSGKIINPHKDFVTLMDFNDFRDTIPLNEDGSFSKSYKKLNAGLYTFTHPNEYQSIYLSPGDSTIFRLNTRAFDETLAFSGSHARENNYLIELFIEIEKDDINFIDNYKLDHDLFKRKIDSVTNARLNHLNLEAKEHQFDKEFICHAEQVIKFSSWIKLERYPLAHYGRNDFLNSNQIPQSFFKYRDGFNIDNEALLNNYAYRAYIPSLINRLALKSSSKELGSGQLVNRGSFMHHKKRLAIIDSLFKDGTLKTIFAANDTRGFIINRKDSKEVNDLVDIFLTMTDDENMKKRITDMAATYIKLEPGNEMPNIKLRNLRDHEISLSDKINKLNVLFFWSADDSEYAANLNQKVKDLRVKYPEINFIGINLDQYGKSHWEKFMMRYDFNPAWEYQVMNTSPVTRQLALENSYRNMVIDKNLTIIDPSVNLFHYQIETTLLGYINR